MASFLLNLPDSLKSYIRTQSRKQGMSMNAFIRDLIEKDRVLQLYNPQAERDVMEAEKLTPGDFITLFRAALEGRNIVVGEGEPIEEQWKEVWGEE